jgi:hypothetical protein
LPAGLDRAAHRLRHEDRVLRAGDRGVHEDRVAAELHRLGRVRRRADAGVDDDRHAALLEDDAEVVRVPDAEPEPIGAASGMTAAQPMSSSRLQATGRR